jgi:putative hemolysin
LSGKRSSRTENARGRIARLLKEGARQGVIGDQHTELIDRILALRVRRVRTRMVPWARVTTISRSLEPESRRRVLKRSRFTRLPVVDNDGRLVGVLNTVRALSDPDRATVDLMRQPLLLDANDSMLEAIDRLRSEGRGMGIVVKAGTLTPLGVVTVKDLVEPLTGELAAW